MKRIAVVLAAIALLGLPPAKAVKAEVRVNVNMGLPPLLLPAPPEFILPPALGFYVAVGVPHDLFRVDNSYYLYRDDAWYRAPYYNGPWKHLERRQLPPGLRRHKFERIRHYRDQEYRRYQDGRDQYRGRRFKPDKEWKEERKEEKRYDREERKDERRFDKEQRKDERRYEKEERKQDREDRKHDRGEERGGRHGGRDN